MADPEIDHGFLYDEQGRVDILNSPFFDVHFSDEDVTANEYIDRILYQLTLAIEEHIHPEHWEIIGRRPPPPMPATFPPTGILSVFLLVAMRASKSFAQIPSSLRNRTILPHAFLRPKSKPKGGGGREWRRARRESGSGDDFPARKLTLIEEDDEGSLKEIKLISDGDEKTIYLPSSRLSRREEYYPKCFLAVPYPYPTLSAF
ncbi:hypothetical protein M5K25_028478 [Dendrobium thyrsiflorum]|uniref:Uncharacterized protein n=1 Tax=Dendrobium thyrsiflorum TaxID=117978 RepID=A0ABD0TT36_DENTH